MLICKQYVTSGVSKDFLTIVRGGDKDLKLPTGNLEFNVKLIINGIKLPLKINHWYNWVFISLANNWQEKILLPFTLIFLVHIFYRISKIHLNWDSYDLPRNPLFSLVVLVSEVPLRITFSVCLKITTLGILWRTVRMLAAHPDCIRTKSEYLWL